MTDLKQYISIEKDAQYKTSDVYNVWFDSQRAYDDGAIRARPMVPREAAFQIVRRAENKFECNGPGYPAFATMAEAEAHQIAKTIEYHVPGLSPRKQGT